MSRVLIYLVLYFASALVVLSHETTAYEFKIIPRDFYPVVKYSDHSLLEYAAKAIVEVVSTVLAIVKGILVNGLLILIGAALAFGICVYTPYCTLTIEEPFYRDLSRLNISYIDDIERYLQKAYMKYNKK